MNVSHTCFVLALSQFGSAVQTNKNQCEVHKLLVENPTKNLLNPSYFL